jgi:arylsulfatase A
MTNDRRTFLKSMAASVLATSANTVSAETLSLALERSSHRAKPTSRPNVLMMICDDLGFGDLGCYGSSIPTPHLDRLAASGTRCTHWNSAHPICSASRAALLTGRYAPRSHTPGALFPHAKVAMALEEQTLANLFRDGGYRTHAVGKWHLGDEAGYMPTDRGFDTYFGVPWSVDMQPLPLIRDKETLETDTDRDELTPRYTEQALKHLEQAGDQPFFLYMAYSYPHDPARGSKEFRGRSEFGDVGDSIQEIDWSVGKLLDVLERTGKVENTVVILTSDHGPWYQGAHGRTRGRKGSTFEGGVRVPFLIRWPGHIRSATVCSEWMAHLCVVPTLVSWCSLTMPKLPVDGFDVSSTLLHGDKAIAKPVIYFASAGDKNDVHAIRAGGWKLRIAQNDGEIYINDHTTGRNNYLLAKAELYNLDRDPCESYDVAKKNPEIVAYLRAELARELPTFPASVQAEFTQLAGRVASVVTPPGAAPRIVTGPRPGWAWEPDDRR